MTTQDKLIKGDRTAQDAMEDMRHLHSLLSLPARAVSPVGGWRHRRRPRPKSYGGLATR